jgi:hypothetical protein
MSLNERLKGLIFLLCLFLTGLFFYPYGNALAIDNDWSVDSGIYTPTHNYKVYYDSNGLLTFEILDREIFTYSYGFTPAYFLALYNNNSGSFQFDQFLLKISGTYRKFRGVLCDSEYRFSTDFYQPAWGNMIWCRIPVGTPYQFHLTSLKNSSNDTVDIYNPTGLTKTDIDTYFGSANYLENNASVIYEIPVICSATIIRNECSYSHNSYYNYTGGIAVGHSFPLGSSSIDGTCGGDDGQYISHEPPTAPLVLCQAGTPTTTTYWNPIEQTWFWGCLGENGGTDDYCLAYLTAEPVDAVCGADSGQTLSEPPDDFCSYGYLITPTYLETITGYSWQCGGYNGGDNVLCTASKGGLTPPEIPETEDCSILSVPDRWFCQISNAIQNAFLPSPEKLNDLNEVLNGIQAKFPFNYISVASEKFDQISGNISDGTLTLTIMGNTGTVNITALSGFNSTLKMMSGFLIILMFVFWAIGYIKHFFR